MARDAILCCKNLHPPAHREEYIPARQPRGREEADCWIVKCFESAKHIQNRDQTRTKRGQNTGIGLFCPYYFPFF
jgi:hypothetical protein